MRVLSGVLSLSMVMVISSIGAVYALQVDSQSSDSKKAVEVEIDGKKRQAIEELLTVTEFDERVNLFSAALASNARKAFRLAIFDEMKDSKSSSKELSKEALDKAVEEESKVLVERYMVLFNEQVDLKEVVRKIAFDTYAKYFSTDELKDIVAFYKTPTGAKARKIMPQLARESLIETQEAMRPKLRSILKSVLDERKNASKRI